MFGDDVLPIDELKLIRSAQAMLLKIFFGTIGISSIYTLRWIFYEAPPMGHERFLNDCQIIFRAIIFRGIALESLAIQLLLAL